VKIRIISAVIAVLLIIVLERYFSALGLIFFCTGVIALGALEYARLLFPNEALAPQILFFFLATLTYLTEVFSPALAFVVLAVSGVLFLSYTVAFNREHKALEDSQKLQTGALLGLVYCVVLPGLATRLLLLQDGETWFFGLLAIVFAGDTFAYFTGRAIGRHKLSPMLSPKKTVEGAVGGLMGSALAGFVMSHYFLTQVPLWIMLPVALLTGAFAQAGDLFESSLKRVAHVKDSGHIMPGHGGALDRADGIYFGAPIYFCLAWYMTLPQSPAFSF
jgi:phosphatidate cytidylyltransferase